VSVFAIDEATGAVTEAPGSPFPSGGTHPTQAEFNASGTMLAVANASGAVQLFAVSQATGALTPVAEVGGAVLAPVIAFGHNLLAVASTAGDGEVSLYAIDEVSGQPLQLPQSLTIPDITSLAMSPDDKLLAIAQAADNQVQVWDTGYPYKGQIVLGSPSYLVPAGVTRTVSAADGLLFGSVGVSSFAAGDTLSVSSAVETTPHGEVTINPDGSFVYAPDPGFVGTDTFQYVVYDGGAGYATGTATVQVTGPLASTPAALDFGTQTLGAPGTVSWLTVTNSGTDPLESDPLQFASAAIISGGANASNFSIPAGDDYCASQTLTVGASCEIGVSFRASIVGPESATLTLGANNAVSQSQPISLTGSGAEIAAPSSAAPASAPTPGQLPTPVASNAPPSLGTIACAVSRIHSHAVVRCSTAYPALNAALATIIVKRGSKVVARGSGHLTGDHISASLRLRNALHGKGSLTVTITAPGLLDRRVVHATLG
jgi:hypothetical protein